MIEDDTELSREISEAIMTDGIFNKLFDIETMLEKIRV